MPRKIHMISIFMIIILLSFVLQLLLRYDFSASNKHYYDIVYVAPYSLPVLVIWYTLFSLLLIYNTCNSAQQISLYVLFILLSALPYIIEVVTNVPSFWARDVYLHGQVHFIDLSSKLEDLNYTYAKQYPSFFVLLYVVYILLGYPDIRYINTLILYPFAILIFLLILFILYRILLKNSFYSSLGVMIAINLLMYNRNELTFQHMNTRLYSLILLFMTLLLLILILKERSSRSVVLFMLSVLTFSISHVLFPLVLVLALFILLIKSKLISETHDTSRSFIFILFPVATLVYLIWNFYNYYTSPTINIGVKTFLDWYYRMLGRELVTYSLTIREPIPWFGTIARNIFKSITLLLTTLAGVHIIRSTLLRRKAISQPNALMIWTSYIVATIITFGITVFTASLGNSINRGLMTLIPLIVPCSIAQILEIPYITKVKKIFIKIVIVAIVVFLSLNQFVLLHEVPVVISNTQPLDNACLFLTRFNIDNTIITASPFMIYYVYFDPNPPQYTYTGDIGLIETIHKISEFYMQNQGVKVLDFRTIVDWSLRYEYYAIGLNEWVKYVLIPLYTSNSLIYSNGNYTWIFL